MVNFEEVISRLMQWTLYIVHDWCEEEQFKDDSDKTILVPFTRRTTKPNGVQIPLSTEL